MKKSWRLPVLWFGILIILVFGLGPTEAQNEERTIRVGVVVVGVERTLQTFCVTIDVDNATGVDALLATGLHIDLLSGALGTQVCQIGDLGCITPEENCFCQCQGGGTCAYWSYFHLGDQSTWNYSAEGAASYRVNNGDVEGWWWRTSDARAEDLPALTFDSICNSSLPFPRTVIDDLGREVTLDSPPLRIASVSLGSDEILLDLVEVERLLGVTYMASDPAISNISERLAGIAHTDLISDAEYLISLEADLVILASYNDPALVDQLLDADVPAFVLSHFGSLDDVRANIRVLGQLTGEEERAEEIIRTMDADLNSIRKLVAPYAPVRVLYYEAGGITYGPGSTVDEIIRLAGGINVIAESGLGSYPLIDREFVLTLDPDVILVSAGFGVAQDPIAWFLDDPTFSSLRAVKSGRVYTIPNAHMTNVSHHVVLGVRDIAQALYPDAFGRHDQ